MKSMLERDYENRIIGQLRKLKEAARCRYGAVREIHFLELTDREKQKTDRLCGYGQRDRVFEDWTKWPLFDCEDTWGGPDYHGIFAFRAVVTEKMAGKNLGFSLDTGADDVWNTDNPQIIAYVNRKLICAMDMNHHEVMLTDCAKEGDVYEICLYAYVNSPRRSNFAYIGLFSVCEEAETLYYDMKTPFEAAMLRHKDDPIREKLLGLLHHTADLLDFRQEGSEYFLASVREADTWLTSVLYEKTEEKDALLKEIETLAGQKEPVVYGIGHTHIDVAWKWPVRQTREKAVRSFATVLYLMDRYPDYRFMSSQPQLYQFVKEEAPELFEKIREKVKEGRWEAEGAMWLESDANLTGGESLIRQILYGKQFFEKEFGITEQRFLWLPDAFGFLGALPQIMKKSGISYFLTTKLGWNEQDQMPDDTFLWEGIDGSRVTGLFITTKNYEMWPERFEKPVREVTYNGRQNADQIMGTWQNYRNKRINTAVMTLYGWGDGGGGPTVGMLEESKRLVKGVPGVPRLKMAGVRDYLEELEKNLEGKTLNTWYGDLYLEYHRSTFTSVGKNKKNNRECEYEMQKAEFAGALAWLLTGTYPAKKLEEAWKLLLLNQFHDILPGSAIEEVYDQCDLEYKKIRLIDAGLIADAEKTVMGAAETGTKMAAMWNPLSFAAETAVSLPPVSQADITRPQLQAVKGASARQLLSDGSSLSLVSLPSKGYAVREIEKECVTERVHCIPFLLHADRELETPWYLVSLNEKGELTRLYDKEAKREVLLSGMNANRLVICEDIPKDYDAWNTDSYFDKKSWSAQVRSACSLTELGEVCAVFHTVLSYQNSEIIQDIVFYGHSRRIDFKTKIDWKEHQQLMKAEFDLDIMSRRAVCEIPYGVIERPTHRNTSWERAKFEMCAHRFVDLSEADYGAALLNDCKYGYRIYDSHLDLTLLTSGIFPYEKADQCEHSMTYALLPHMGDYREGNVVKEAALLNWKPQGDIVFGREEKEYSLLSFDREGIYADSVKVSEDQKDLIVRVYDESGSRQTVSMKLGIQAGAVWECDLMEKAEKEYELKENSITFTIRPFEILTFRISPAK